MLADLVALSSSLSSSGNVLEDLASALSAITIGSDSRLYFIVRPEDAAQLAVQQAALGGVAFPGVGVNGGTVGNIVVIVSDALADGTALLVDASQLLTASTPLKLDASEEAMLDMAGGNNPTYSLWQKNSAGVRAERMVAVHALRATAVQSLSGVGYSGGSPS